MSDQQQADDAFNLSPAQYGALQSFQISPISIEYGELDRMHTFCVLCCALICVLFFKTQIKTQNKT